MNIDFTALLDTMIMLRAETESPITAKLLKVFTKRGIKVTDAMSMLMEICTIAGELNDGKEQN